MTLKLEPVLFAALAVLALRTGASAPLERPGIRAWRPPAERAARFTRFARTIGDSCQSDDPERLCIALRYVSYEEDNGTVVVSRKLAIEQIRQVNALWAQCGIAFQIESYETVNPHGFGLHFGPRSEDETYQIRKRYAQDSSFLVVTTGEWSSYAVAWTEPPANETHGAILSGAVAGDPEILGHELGHYMNLDHPVEAPKEVRSNLMNWRVYTDSHTLTAKQCNAARESVALSWQGTRR